MDPLVPTKEPKESITVTPDQIIYHRRVRVVEHARRTSVSEACRTFGVSRTTFYRWQHRVETGGLDALMPKGRRPPAMPNQTPAWVVDELLAEAVVRPTLGARRYAHDLGKRGFVISASGVQKILGRHQLGRRRQRVAALAQLTAATTGLLADDAREGPFGFCHFAARPGDCPSEICGLLGWPVAIPVSSVVTEPPASWFGLVSKTDALDVLNRFVAA
jgi:transposase